ncbi:MAG: Gldg family protein [Planctomycetota bacterium]
MTGWLNLLLSAALALGAWALATVLFAQPRLKQLFDWSPQARFSVEPATAQLLQGLVEKGEELEFHTIFVPPQTFTVTGPEGEQVRALHLRLQELTRDLLRQYDYLGGEAVRVVHHDLLSEPAAIKEVLREVTERNYNSVVVKKGKRSKVLHLLDDLAELNLPSAGGGPVGSRRTVPTLKSYKGEEALSTAVKKLLVEGAPKIYFLRQGSGSLTAGIAASYSELVGALSDDGFEIAQLDLAQGDVPQDATAVGLLGPVRELPADVTTRLWRYLRRGGRVLLSVAFIDKPQSWNPTFRALGARAGFAIGDELVCHVIPDPRDPSRSTMGDPQVQNIVVANLNATHPITRPLWRVQRFPRMKACREIRRLEPTEDGVRLDTSIFRTGPGAWLEDRPVDFIGPPPADGVYASRCVGAIADIDPEEGDRTGHLVLLGGACFDNLGFSLNGDLALNLFNWMAERSALVSIRGRKYVPRALALAPQQIDRAFWLLVVAVPGVLLLLGLMVFWRRGRV